jgi:hypothetical protein
MSLHNLDIEITALRDGWGAWCEEYQRIDDERRRAVGLLHAIRDAFVRGEPPAVLGNLIGAIEVKA